MKNITRQDQTIPRSTQTGQTTVQLRTPISPTGIEAAISPLDRTEARSLIGRATFQAEICTSSKETAIEDIMVHRLKFSSLRIDLRGNKKATLAEVSKNDQDLRNAIDVAAAAVAPQNTQPRQYIPKSILKSASAEIARNPDFLPFVDPSLISYEIAQKAINRLLRFVPAEILENTPKNIEQQDDIISCALNGNPQALDLIPWELLTAEMLSVVIRRHKTNNKAELIRSLVKFTKEMGRKTSAEIRFPHLDLDWPLLEFFEKSKRFMLILINKYGLGITDVSSDIKNYPDIIAADAQTLQQSLGIAPKRNYLQTSLDGPILPFLVLSSKG